MQAAPQVQKSQSVARTFWRFAIPSIVAMLVSGLYQIIDGFFVGHFVGADGLASINMAIPLLGLIMGFGLLVGMGGGSVLSKYRGEKNLAATQATLVTALFLIILIGLLATIVFIAFGKKFAQYSRRDGRHPRNELELCADNVVWCAYFDWCECHADVGPK